MDKLKHLTTPFLLLALLLIVLPLMELAGSVLPVGLGNAEWRFGAVGLVSNALLLPLLGSFIVVVIAAQGEKKRLQVAMSVLNGLAAFILLVAVPLFMLDSLELRSRVPDAARLAFDWAALRAVTALGFAVVVLAALSRGGFKSSRPVADPGDVGDARSAMVMAPDR